MAGQFLCHAGDSVLSIIRPWAMLLMYERCDLSHAIMARHGDAADSDGHGRGIDAASAP